MDEDVPFKLNITCDSSVVGRDDGGRFRVQNVRFRLLRHIRVDSAGGRLTFEKGLEIAGGGKSAGLIGISGLGRATPPLAPADEYPNKNTVLMESSENLRGTLRVESGWKEARACLEEGRHVKVDAARHADKVEIAQPVPSLTIPSFQYKGLSIDYTIGIEVVMAQYGDGSITNTNDCDDLTQGLFTAHVETSPIKLNTRSSLTMQEALTIHEDDSGLSEERPSPPPSSTPTRRTSTPTPRSSPHLIRRVPVVIPPLSPDRSRVSLHLSGSPLVEEGRDTVESMTDPAPSSPKTSNVEEAASHSIAASSAQTNCDAAGDETREEVMLADLNESPDPGELASSSSGPRPSTDDRHDDADHPAMATPTSRERSATILSRFSQLSGQTLEGLPPAYALHI
jgi:hypothetical protein